LPPDVRRQLDEATRRLEGVLWKLADGALETEVLEDLRGVLDGSLDAARAAGATKRSGRSRLPREVDFGMVIASHVRALRRDRELTQAQLARGMRRLGFDWKRVTVAEVEAGADKPEGGRKVALEELQALAIFFGVPMASFLIPEERDMMTMRVGEVGVARALDAGLVKELLLGEGASIGGGGPGWKAARRVAGVGEWDWRLNP